MVTPPEIEARILRLYHAEKWLIGTIAQQLHVHYSVVGRVLAQAGLPRPGPPPRKSRIDPYLAFIRQTLETFPALTASRLYVMVRERGYRGSPDHFRHLIACHRPRPKAEAYLRLRSLPGEQGQVDWGHFGHLEIGRARRPLMAFVMVLSHSRQIFLRFFPDARMENFLRGHVAAFTAWNGVPRVLLYGSVQRMLVWTAPGGIECARMRSLQLISDRRPSVEQISRIGMDTSKHVFQLHGVNAAEVPVLRKKLRRKEMVAFFQKLAPTVIAIEACGASHHLARLLQSFGHTVKLIAPQLVKPYVKRGKNDAADAEALCEAMSRPTMRFVPVKTT